LKYWLLLIGLLAPLVALVGGCASSPPPGSSDIPDSLRVPATEVLAYRAKAKGVQIYRCAAGKDDAAHFAWLLKAPEADLYDAAGGKIGKHYAGPTWEARDGGKVIGEVVAHANSPDPNGIAWLLLKANSAPGTGIFGNVRYVQRLHTVGGIAPADGCDQSTAGSETRVQYSADYWFYVDKP
jgi:hypothetical protein